MADDLFGARFRFGHSRTFVIAAAHPQRQKATDLPTTSASSASAGGGGVGGLGPQVAASVGCVLGMRRRATRPARADGQPPPGVPAPRGFAAEAASSGAEIPRSSPP